MALFLASMVGFVYGEIECNQKFPVKVNEVTYITSPNYPGNFTEYVDCYYELYTAAQNRGLVIFVDVLNVTLDCLDETAKLKVFSDFSRNPRALGTICEGGQTTFSSPKQSLYLTFRSRVHLGEKSRGFRLRIRSEPRYCHCYNKATIIKEASRTPALITTPFYPSGAEANVQCRWLLKSPLNSRVNATILDANMRGSHGCHKFALYIYDGKTTNDNSLLASVCDDNPSRNVQSSGPYMLVFFTSGSMVYNSGGGIKLQYSSILEEEPQQLTLINQALFFVITALLIVIIATIVVIALLKLFLLPYRRKLAERRRRESRANLTRVASHNSSQLERSSQSHWLRDNQSGPNTLGDSQSLPGSLSGCCDQSGMFLQNNVGCQSEPCSPRSVENTRHNSLLGTSSMISLSSALSSDLTVNSDSFFSRLLAFYGLKKSRRDSRRPLANAPDHLGQGERTGSGITVGIPEFYENEAFAVDLPPAYEDVIRQSAVRESLGRALQEEEVRTQTPESDRQNTVVESVRDSQGSTNADAPVNATSTGNTNTATTACVEQSVQVTGSILTSLENVRSAENVDAAENLDAAEKTNALENVDEAERIESDTVNALENVDSSEKMNAPESVNTLESIKSSEAVNAAESVVLAANVVESADLSHTEKAESVLASNEVGLKSVDSPETVNAAVSINIVTALQSADTPETVNAEESALAVNAVESTNSSESENSSGPVNAEDVEEDSDYSHKVIIV